MIINQSQIVSIEINPLKLSENIVYRDEEINFWGKITVKEGLYRVRGVRYPIYEFLNNVPSHIVINNNQAFEKCHLFIEFSNGKEHKHYFNNEEEMNVYVKREFQGREWKNLNE